MTYSFDDTAGISQNSAKKAFEGNAIYEVTFDGCEARDFEGKQDASKTFKVLDIKFSNPDGYFTHTVFEPTEEDAVDREGAFGPQPSNVKAMMLLFKHLIDAVNPELGKAIDRKEKSLNTTSWDSLRQLVVKATDSGKGTTTKIKLIKNNKGEAMFPYFANYSKEGALYMSTNFIGKNIFFTNKELNKISEAKTAAPTPVEELTVDSNEANPEVAHSKDMNWDI